MTDAPETCSPEDLEALNSYFDLLHSFAECAAAGISPEAAIGGLLGVAARLMREKMDCTVTVAQAFAAVYAGTEEETRH